MNPACRRLPDRRPRRSTQAYDGSSYFNSGLLYRADTGRPHSLTLTFTKTGTFPYVDVGDFFMEMQGSVIVTPP